MASAPRRYRGSGSLQSARRAAISSSDSSTSTTPLVDVDDHDVAFAQRRERAALRGLGRDVTDHEPVRGAREAAVGDQRDGFREALADDRGGDVQHLAHAGAAVRALVADHDHVALADRAGFHRREGVLLGVEDAGRPSVQRAIVPGELHRAPAGSEVAVEHGDTAAWLERRLDRHHDLLALGLDGRVRDLAERAPVDAAGIRVQEASLPQLAYDEPDPAGAVHVVGVPAPPRLHVGDDRRGRRDPLEVVDRELDPEVAGDGDEVEDAVRRAARRGHGGGRVLERLPRHDGARPHVVAHELHGELADLVRRLLLVAVHGRDPVGADRRQPEEVEDRRHRVGGELAAAGARPGARC